MSNNATMRRLGDYIRQVDVRNRDLKVTRLVGVNLDKEFMPSVANTVGTDMATYKIVSYNQFGCKLMSVERDRRMPISLMKDREPALISSAYYVFEVIDENILNPDFLFLQIKNPEFDRRLWFSSGGDVRGGVGFENLEDMPIYIPPIEEQREIVARHKAIEHKIDVNRRLIAKLEETARTIYRHTFVENIDPENLPAGWRMGTLADFGKVITGKTPSSSCPDDFGNDYPFVTPGDFVGNKYLIQIERGLSKNGYDKLRTKAIRPGDVMVTCIGSDMGKVAIANQICISNQQINSIIVNNVIYTDYLYYTLSAMKQKLFDLGMGSSTLPLLNKSDFENIEIIIPNESVLKTFSNSVRQMGRMILLLQTENLKVSNLIEPL